MELTERVDEDLVFLEMSDDETPTKKIGKQSAQTGQKGTDSDWEWLPPRRNQLSNVYR